jgi:predicted O-methyltransferase YrrM
MNTLATFANLLDRLFADDQASRATLESKVGALPKEQRDAFFAGMADYKNFYGAVKDVHLAVSRETARLLYLLACTGNARNVVEFGTSFGLSTLHLAAAVKDNCAESGGGGKVITSEFEPSKIEAARTNFDQTGLGELIELRPGDALETLSRDLPENIDLLLLDGAKSLYPRILALVEPHLRAGAVVVADNADMCPDYLDHVRDPSSGYLSMPFGEDVELSLRVGQG